MERAEIAGSIARRLRSEISSLRTEFDHPGRIRTCVIDQLLDVSLARRIGAGFPPLGEMMHRKTFREDKYVAAQMDRYEPLLEEVLFAFQEPPVLEAVSAITGLADLVPDSRLYAGGISAMRSGQFLSPHIDNSHDGPGELYRVLNLLYYTTPDWEPEFGGNLQVWDDGLRGPVRTLNSSFNRLVIMATSRRSWHAVDQVVDRPAVYEPVDHDPAVHDPAVHDPAVHDPAVHGAVRTCVSTYYFSRRPVSNEGELLDQDYHHVTTFRAFPGNPGRNALLVADGIARASVRRVFRNGVVPTRHIYDRPGP